MVLVLLGTQNNSFVRLLKEVEKCIDNGIIKEEVIAQIGNTDYSTEKMCIKKFYSQQEIEELIDNANLIITHGGVGSIITSINKQKKVIAVPRLKEYKEHVNNHQVQIVDIMNEKGYIIGVKNLNDLSKKIKESKNFKPKKFVSNTYNIINIIEEYVTNN